MYGHRYCHINVNKKTTTILHSCVSAFRRGVLQLGKKQLAGEARADFVQISVSIARMHCKKIAFFSALTAQQRCILCVVMYEYFPSISVARVF